MLENRQTARVCPVCGTDSITQILCDTVLSAHFCGMACPSEGVAAFHCKERHIFLLLRNDFKWGEPVSTMPAESEMKNAASSRSSFKQQVASRFQAVTPSFGLLLAAMLGRERKFQSLGLLG